MDNKEEDKKSSEMNLKSDPGIKGGPFSEGYRESESPQDPLTRPFPLSSWRESRGKDGLTKISSDIKIRARDDRFSRKDTYFQGRMVIGRARIQ
jgi:hypothetical protein